MVPVFSFDPRIYGASAITKYDTRKTGLLRSRFQVETVKEMREQLAKIGSKLVLTNETPEEFIPKLVLSDANTHNIIVYQQEICSEELEVDQKVKDALK